MHAFISNFHNKRFTTSQKNIVEHSRLVLFHKICPRYNVSCKNVSYHGRGVRKTSQTKVMSNEEIPESDLYASFFRILFFSFLLFGFFLKTWCITVRINKKVRICISPSKLCSMNNQSPTTERMTLSGNWFHRESSRFSRKDPIFQTRYFYR